MKKERRRTSIHDITNVNDSGEIAVPQGPFTNQTNGSPRGNSSGKQSTQPSQSLASTTAVGMYGGTTIGQAVGGPLVSAVGTPVNLPQPAHMAYGVSVRVPVHGQVVPGAPVTMAMPYPMPHPSSRQ